MTVPITDNELLAFLDEELPTQRAAEVEKAMRDSVELRQRAAGLLRYRDQGGHTIAEIWRRYRLTCPSRSQLGAFLVNALPHEEADYVDFHVETVGCRYCQASLEDLKAAREKPHDVPERQRKVFESSAGHLRTGRR